MPTTKARCHGGWGMVAKRFLDNATVLQPPHSVEDDDGVRYVNRLSRAKEVLNNPGSVAKGQGRYVAIRASKRLPGGVRYPIPYLPRWHPHFQQLSRHLLQIMIFLGLRSSMLRQKPEIPGGVATLAKRYWWNKLMMVHIVGKSLTETIGRNCTKINFAFTNVLLRWKRRQASTFAVVSRFMIISLQTALDFFELPIGAPCKVSGAGAARSAQVRAAVPKPVNVASFQ
ncbi:hypothetical protein EDD15DRAFT_2357948 [Pisolithus albus]|nr:hypothetical protein EDD15DRAFT_2357948 [Pisolithus albus]